MWYNSTKKAQLSELLTAGVISGVIAGIAMGLVAMVLSVVSGHSAWTPLKMIAITVIDRSWLDTSGFQTTPVLVGLMIHLAVGVGLGGLYPLLLGRVAFPHSVGWGVVYGVAIWLAMQFFVLQMVNPVMASQTPYWMMALEHVVFGATLGIYPKLMTSADIRQQTYRQAA